MSIKTNTTVWNQMKIYPIFILLLSSFLSNAAPINNECVNPVNPDAVNCPNDPFHNSSYAFDYMNFGYAWDKSFGTARVFVLDSYVNLNTRSDSEYVSRLRMHDSGTYVNYVYGNLPIADTSCSFRNNKMRGNSYGAFNYGRSPGQPNFGQSYMPAYTSSYASDKKDFIINEFRFNGTSGTNFIEVAVKAGIAPSTVNFTGSAASPQPVHIANIGSDFTYGSYLNGYYIYYFMMPDNQFTSYGISSGTSYTTIARSKDKVQSNNYPSASMRLTDCYSYASGIYEPENTVGIGYADNWYHGDWILSLLGAETDNGFGMSSYCRECSIAFGMANHGLTGVETSLQADRYRHQNEKYEPAVKAFRNAIDQGNQIINLSGFLSADDDVNDVNFTPNCDDQTAAQQQDICTYMRVAKWRDMAFVASAGNNGRAIMNFPASDSEYVIGVGGSDINGNIWDDGNCVDVGSECGSQYQLGQINIMAPAKNVLVYDDYFGFNSKSGTSFAAPLITGYIAMFRSLNPLLPLEDMVDKLQSSRVNTQGSVNYSIPNGSSIIKKYVLGFANGSRVHNRLKPMFRLYHTDNAGKNYLMTSIPQLAVAALAGSYMAPIDNFKGVITSKNIKHYSENTDPLAVGYSTFKKEFGGNNDARAPFYIFGGHHNPFTGQDDLIPLHHYSYKKYLTYCNDVNARNAYTTTTMNNFSMNTGVGNFCGTTNAAKMMYEGIEGYIMPSCPVAGGCYEHTSNPSSPQCIKLRRSYDVVNGKVAQKYALIMESEVNDYPEYTDISNLNTFGLDDSECLGYVFPNVDSDNDLVIDGMELVLGTDPNDSDSDDDGIMDGVEYPPAASYVSDPLIQN